MVLTVDLFLQMEWMVGQASRRRQQMSVGLVIQEGRDAEADREFSVIGFSEVLQME